MAAPAISLIIPCYNTPEEQIARALESVRAQDFSDYEVLLVDDGGDAAHRAVYERLSGLDARCRLIVSERNGGVAAARNLGIRSSRGDYIAFLDGDDVLTPWFFRESHAAALETGADLVLGGVRLTDSLPAAWPAPEGEPARDLYRGEAVASLKKYYVCRQWELRDPDYAMPRGPIARLVRRALCERIGFPEGMTVGEDTVWCLQVLSESETVCVVHSLWYWYWQNPASAVHRFHPDMKDQWERQLAEMKPCLDLTLDAHYLAFVMHVHDGIFYLWRCYFRHAKDHPERKAEMRAVRRAICTDAPWTMLGERRFFRRSGKKYKIIALLYRARLLLPVMDLWQRLKGKR